MNCSKRGHASASTSISFERLDDGLLMPQPLSRVKKITTRSGGPAMILQRPELAALVAAVLTSWSHTEAAFGRFLAICLHTDSSAGVAMYLSLSGAEARRSALSAAAHKTLPPDKIELFELVTKAIRPVRDRRNDFAHGLWSYSDELPDALLWESADDEIENFEKIQKRSGSTGTKIMVYTKADLLRDLKDAQQAPACAHQLGILVNPAHAALHDETLKRLLASPLLKKLGANPPR
jgi:hypothetical protein